MRKLTWIFAMLLVTYSSNAQGLLNKLKAKVASATEKATAPAAAATSSTTTSNGNFTDPAKFGTVIRTLSKEDLNARMGGDGGNIAIYIISANVVDGDLQFKMGDYNTSVYSYKNGALTLTDEKPDFNNLYKFYNGSEQDLISSDFTQTDNGNAMMKTGGHVASGIQAGKPTQTYTFNGKTIGQFMSASLSHNADSSVVVVSGIVIDKGATYHMKSSSGQDVVLPVPFMSSALISPDGKSFAAVVQTPKGLDVYPSAGDKFSINYYAGQNIWLRNTGSLFYFDGKNQKSLFKNTTLFHTFDVSNKLEIKQLFIGKDETGYAWMGDRALYFSDGTVFSEAKSPYRVVMNGKDLIIFLVADVKTGQIYLCRHEI